MFREGDLVELIPLFKSKKGNKFILRITKGKKFSTKYGDIELDSLIGRDPGIVVKTHLGYSFIALDPALASKVKSTKVFRFETQIIYPRDWGLIIAFSNIRSGSRVVEIGTGSGAFTAFLSEIVGKEGKIWSYDVDESRLKNAEKNLKTILKDQENVVLKKFEFEKGIEETNVDVVFIDVPEPWKIIKSAWCSLRPGGFLIVYVPTYNQVQKTVIELIINGFVDIKVIEGFIREIQYKPYAIRPEMKGYLFSAYIIFSRKSFVIPYKLYRELIEFYKEY